jgi:hypothetical protein
MFLTTCVGFEEIGHSNLGKLYLILNLVMIDNSLIEVAGCSIGILPRYLRAGLLCQLNHTTVNAHAHNFGSNNSRHRFCEMS